MRFARLRMEKRHNYVRKVAETAVQLFVSNDKVNVAGMVLAGSADFKTELSQSDMFDPVCLWILPICLAWRSLIATFPLKFSSCAIIYLHYSIQ